MRELLQRPRRQAGAQPEIADGIEARAARRLDLPAPFFGEAADLAKAETQRMGGVDVAALGFMTGMDPLVYFYLRETVRPLSISPPQAGERADCRLRFRSFTRVR